MCVYIIHNRDMCDLLIDTICFIDPSGYGPRLTRIRCTRRASDLFISALRDLNLPGNIASAIIADVSVNELMTLLDCSRRPWWLVESSWKDTYFVSTV